MPKKRITKSITARKKAKKLYNAFRYKKKKLIKVIEEIEKNLINIYGNRQSNKLANFSRKDIELLYKKAVSEKDTYSKRKINELFKEVKGSKKNFYKSWGDTLQEDLRLNIYGSDKRRLSKVAKDDLKNFETLFNGLNEKQKLEFLNSNSYYGARRYQKPPATSESFIMQVQKDGASYIVDNLKKYYEDNGLTLPKDLIIIV